ncbi:hypothetical protein HOY80DRAFT_897641, partial [Tuber brumale]
PLFIPDFILTTSEDPSLVRWPPFFIISATLAQSLKSIAFTPLIGYLKKKSRIIL